MSAQLPPEPTKAGVSKKRATKKKAAKKTTAKKKTSRKTGSRKTASKKPPKPGPSDPQPVATEDRYAMALTVAFRLVASRKVAHPERLIDLKPDVFWAAIHELLSGKQPDDPLLAAHQLLAKDWGQITPSPLWMSWMETTCPAQIQRLVDGAAPHAQRQVSSSEEGK